MEGRKDQNDAGLHPGRLSEDYSPEDLMLVVDYLTEKWAKDPKMSDYLRPKTLFAPENCVEYFDKAKKWDTAGRPAWANGKWVSNDQAFKSSYAEVNYTVPAGFRS
jgi:uncharacterized phage protein (TIGR02220 family)